MKSLVIYFSHTGENYMSDGIRNIDKGNTEIVAETIKDITGADLFKVETVKEYPYNYQKCCDVAKDELNSDLRPELKNKLDNISEYDVIYIGGPVWWSIAAWPVDTFVKSNDFNGKTVIPFCTSASSSLGQSSDLLAKEANTGNWKEGYRFSSDASSSDIKTWTDSLK